MRPTRAIFIIKVELFHKVALILISSPLVAQDETVYRSLTELNRLIRSKQISPVELATHFIERAERIDPQLFAFVTFTKDLAIEQAREAERRAMRGKLRSPIDGIPWGV